MILKSLLALITATAFTFVGYAQTTDKNPFENMTFTVNGASNYSACPGDPLYFELENIDEAPDGFMFNYEWYTSPDNVTWSSKGSYSTLSYSMPMPDDGFYIKVKASQVSRNPGPPAPAQNEKEVSKEIPLSSNCGVRLSHLTSTGDYFCGTDFNPKAGVSTPTPTIPEQVINYFSENDVTVISNNPNNYYNVTTDLRSLFGSYAPSLDEGSNSNYYYLYENNPTNNTPFEYQINCATYAGKHYRFKMRFYLLKTSGNCGANAKIKLETTHSNQTTDRATLDIYDDRTGAKMKTLDITQTFGSINLGIGGAEYANKLLRVEITYYGYFPDDKYDPTKGTYDGLQYFTLRPLFQQFDGCFSLAIDYVSIEPMSVSVAQRSECVGSPILANAEGFPRNAENDCGNAVCPNITGKSKVDVTAFPYSQEYVLDNESALDWMGTNGTDYTYQWSIVAPDGLTSDVTKVYLDEDLGATKATIRVEDGARMDGSFTSDEKYRLELSAYRISNGIKETNAVCTKEMPIELNEILLIENVADLQALRDGINTGKAFTYKGFDVPAGSEGKNFKLAADLDLSSVCSATKGSWTPIGMYVLPSGGSIQPFKGNFDGDGHTISNLYINAPQDYRVGLFGYIQIATIKNLKLVGTDVTGKQYVGGVCGYTHDKSNINYSSNSGSVSGTGDDSNVGGICGYKYYNCIITACYFDKQMCPDVNGVGISAEELGTEGKLTKDMAGETLRTNTTGDGWTDENWKFFEGMYPIPAGLKNSEAVLAAATPIFLANDETANAVASNFTVGTGNNVTWSADNTERIVSINGSEATLGKNGEVTLP